MVIDYSDFDTYFRKHGAQSPLMKTLLSLKEEMVLLSAVIQPLSKRVSDLEIKIAQLLKNLPK